MLNGNQVFPSDEKPKKLSDKIESEECSSDYEIDIETSSEDDRKPKKLSDEIVLDEIESEECSSDYEIDIETSSEDDRKPKKLSDETVLDEIESEECSSDYEIDIETSSEDERKPKKLSNETVLDEVESEECSSDYEIDIETSSEDEREKNEADVTKASKDSPKIFPDNINKKRVRRALSPSILTLFQTLSHAVFLILFGMWLVSVLEASTFGWLEFVIWAWIVCYGLEIGNQCIRNPLRKNWVRKLLSRKSLSSWNIFYYMELVALVMFLISWILRVVAFVYQDNTSWMEWTRILFSIDFMIYALLPLQYCYTNKFLGPKLIIIIKMTNVLAQFLLIVLAFFLSFAVASQAVLYSYSKMNPLLAFNISFWSVFGEFSLDDLNLTAECTEDSSLYNSYTQLRCPSDAGAYYVPVLMGIYIVIVNVLLFDLLIALFNIDIKGVERTAEELWNLQTTVFTVQQSKTIFLPPPFFILSPLLIWCQENESHGPFAIQEQADDQSPVQLRHIEAEQRDLCLNVIEAKRIKTKPFAIECPHEEKKEKNAHLITSGLYMESG